MVYLNQVIAQIRFQLEQLSSQNAHHEFEHLCRHLTRNRICSNILPATGPVSSAGDQGRDFETFRTFLDSASLTGNAFIGLISDNPLVFACSLQKNILSKIKSDIETIMSSGSEVSGVYYFCTTDVPVGKRHELKDWAKNTFSINLEIIDGQAISEFLAEPDAFWIAVQYLSIPEEIYPKPVKDPLEWYDKLRHSSESNLIINYAMFCDIKQAARYALNHKEKYIDLTFWIKSISAFSESTLYGLSKRASYEVIVLSIRGLRTLLGQEERVRKYLNDIHNINNSSDFNDAAIILNYCIGACFSNNLNINKDELYNWKKTLIEILEDHIIKAETPGLKCPLLEVRGFLALSPDLKETNHIDIDGAYKWWGQMIDQVEDAPLFPLESFADYLTDFIPFIGNHEQYSVLTQKTDTLLTDRQGGYIAAEKCLDRAKAFVKTGQITQALNHLHKSKIAWFTEETLESSLAVMLLISSCYEELQLLYAAKYYTFAVAFVSINSPDLDIKYILPKALIRISSVDYALGNWSGFLDFSELGLKAHGLFSSDVGDFEKNKELESVIFNSTMVKVITEIFDQDLAKCINGRMELWPFQDWLSELYPIAHSIWYDKDPSEIWECLEEQLLGRPFGDVSKTREFSWSELGISLRVLWANTYELTPIAEQFIAIFQIFLADLVNYDLCVLKTDITVSVSQDDRKRPHLNSLPSNKGRKWELVFPQKEDINNLDIVTECLALSTTILLDVTLIPSEKFFKIIENRFKEGVSSKIFVAKPYEVIYRFFITEDFFAKFERKNKNIPENQRAFTLQYNKALGWYDKPGPGYTPETSKEWISNRYRRLIIPIKYTIERLKRETPFKNTVKSLKENGWKDWHILAAINGAVLNYRVQKSNNIQEFKQEYLKLINVPETKESLSVPLSEFTEKKLRFHIQNNMLSFLNVLKLEIKQNTPDIDAINHFLANRYNYWSDDIEHDSFF